ncbi:hypothetical protein [Bifidobacterium vansinderenii]|uniref:Terminase n=1 Tax=Bifidobacterium vansinderenii TaxID=1984871 RepID=A0A229VWA0_9BIFI|nr:hypothetical protein [Bifidobacterium vansinderenii]OXM99886.1 terminase [Bifidobacterium vansinderenii]
MVELHGCTEPRLWTKPLRELSEESSLGYEVIDYAEHVLHVSLRPWQRWLLIHMLELREDGSYRFSKVIILVARQNGKTTLGAVLADWWLHVDSRRHPDRVPPVEFLIVGVSQSLDNAREPWDRVVTWCNPLPRSMAEQQLVIPALQEHTLPISFTNGKEHITADNLASYEIRAVKSARGKPAARVLMDELREQKTFDGWNAVEPTTSSFWSGMLVCLSNAGDATSVVLQKQRDAALTQIDEFEQNVGAGLMTPAEYALQRPEMCDTGLFEWSAPDGCALDDEAAIRQSNPSIGFGGKSVASVRSKIQGMTEAGYRTEYLCQWVTADVEPPFPQPAWLAGVDPDSHRAEGAPTYWGVDTSADRGYSTIAVVSKRDDGNWHGEIVARRPGIDWLIRWFRERPAKHYRVAFQGRGAPVSSVAELLHNLPNVETVPVTGPDVAASFGRMWDAVSACEPGAKSDSLKLFHRPSPVLDDAAKMSATRKLGDGAWGLDRQKSLVDAAPLIALGMALWLAENEGRQSSKLYPSAYAGRSTGLLMV